MRERAPFLADDLEELDGLLSKAAAVVPMQEVADGLTDPDVLGLRHDVDNLLAPAVALAEWEAARGYRSTYFVLPTAPYWSDKDTLRAALEVIAEGGHEIGYHLNSLAEALRTGCDPIELTHETVAELRGYGYPVRGVVAHGDPACYEFNFVNDEMMAESARPSYGEPDRMLGDRVRLSPVPRSTFGFDYDPNWLPRGEYLSDSGGQWSQRFEDVAGVFPANGPLHLLQHPCWWSECFTPAEVAA